MFTNRILNKIKELLKINSYIEFYRPLDKSYLISIIDKNNERLVEGISKAKWILKFEKRGIYLNLKPNKDFWFQFLKEYKIKRKLKSEIQCTDITSFNPTGLPHIGNWQVFSQGGCLKRIKELIYRNFKVDSIYFVNDIGGQINRIIDALNNNSELTGYDIRSLKERGIEWNEWSVTNHFLNKIKDQLSLFDNIKHNYIYETRLDYERERVLNILEDYLKSAGQALYIPYKNDKIFLTKSDGQYTYILSDAALQWKLSNNYRSNLLVIGKDHLTHAEHLMYLMNLINLKDFLRISYIGKLKVCIEGKIVALSKRKLIDIPNLNYSIRLQKLILFFVNKSKDNVVSESYRKDCRLKVIGTLVAFFRIKNMMKYNRYSSNIDEELIIILSKLEEILKRSSDENNSYHLASYCFKLAKKINNLRTLLTFPLILRLRQVTLLIKWIINV